MNPKATSTIVDTTATAPFLEVRGVAKHYGSVTALDGVDLVISGNEIVALVGDNGAGKSTLVKILSGALAPSSGSLRIHGQAVTFASPLHARELGIETVYQDLALALDLDAAANLYLGREIVRAGIGGWFGWLDNAAMARGAERELAELGVSLRAVDAPCVAMSGGQRQGIAVARAAAWGSGLIMLDEPTAALGVAQQEGVNRLIRRIKSKGIPVLLISHNLPQVLGISDRVVVLRRGVVVADVRTEETSVEELVAWITGAGGDGHRARSAR